jgi:hypothetical protein
MRHFVGPPDTIPDSVLSGTVCEAIAWLEANTDTDHTERVRQRQIAEGHGQ